MKTVLIFCRCGYSTTPLVWNPRSCLQSLRPLNCLIATGFVRKRISLTESRQPGGWPKNCYVNLQPNGVKSLFRINIDALQEHLNQQEEEAKVCEM